MGYVRSVRRNPFLVHISLEQPLSRWGKGQRFQVEYNVNSDFFSQGKFKKGRCLDD